MSISSLARRAVSCAALPVFSALPPAAVPGAGVSVGVIAAAVGSLVAVATAADPDEYEFAGSSIRFGVFDDAGSEPPVTVTHLRAYERVLGLTDDQRAIAQGLWEQMLDDHRRLWTDTREQLADLRADRARKSAEEGGGFMAMLSGDSSDAGEAVNAAYESGAAELEARFFDDLRLTLDAGQEASWADLERTRRRLTTLAAWATFSEERADLVELVNDLGLDTVPASVGESLTEYAGVLDSVLSSRNRLAASLGELADEHSVVRMQMLSGVSSGEGVDPQEMMAQMMAARSRMGELEDEIVRAALSTRSAAARVRDVNVQFAQRIEEELGGEGTDAADRFRVAFARANDAGEGPESRGLFGRSRAEMAITEALAMETRSRLRAIRSAAEESGIELPGAEFTGLFGSSASAPGLSPDQTDRVMALRSRYESRRAAIQRRWADELRRPEDDALSVGSSEGPIRLNKKQTDEDESVRSVSMSFVVAGGGGRSMLSSDTSLPQGYRDDIAALEQSVIDELRAILTMDQRAVIANY